MDRYGSHIEGRPESGRQHRTDHPRRLAPLAPGRTLRILLCVTGLGILMLGIIGVRNGAERIGRHFPGFLMLDNRLVMSVAPSEWEIDRFPRVFFSKVIGIEGTPANSAADIHRAVARVPPETPIRYRFRKQADVFTERIPVRRFTEADFTSIYLTYFGVGICFSLAGFWILLRPCVSRSATIAYFVFCQTVALLLFTGGDIYGPYHFTTVYFTAHSLIPATLSHLALSYPEPAGQSSPWRRILLAVLYAVGLCIAGAFYRFHDEESLFLPLLYTVYLLIANGLLLFIARLLIGLRTISSPPLRQSVRRCLLGMLISGLLAGVIFVIYPALEQAIPPIILVAPLGFFPLLTAAGMRAGGRIRLEAPRSIRMRLSLLFLGIVETAFLIGVAFFWLNDSRERLLDDYELVHRQHIQVQRFIDSPRPSPRTPLRPVELLVQTEVEQNLVAAAQAAAAQGNLTAARKVIDRLVDYYRSREKELRERRATIGSVGTWLVVVLIVGGIVQAVTFMFATQRWLVVPIDELARATRIIATGNLKHRIRLDASEELVGLADSVNQMAESLAENQGRAEAERDARSRAASAARDRERRRLGRELHDSILQDLGALKLALESRQRRQPDGALEPIIDGVMGTISELRRLVDDIRPPDLSHESLAKALTSYSTAATSGGEVALHLELEQAEAVPDWAVRDVYRVVQEAVSNCMRHGQARELSLSIHKNGPVVVIEVQDDGVGFDPEGVVYGGGLRGMSERASALGGVLKIDSSVGHGTRIRFVLPASRD